MKSFKILCEKKFLQNTFTIKITKYCNYDRNVFITLFHYSLYRFSIYQNLYLELKFLNDNEFYNSNKFCLFYLKVRVKTLTGV